MSIGTCLGVVACLTNAILLSQNIPAIVPGTMNTEGAKTRVKATAAGWTRLADGQAAAVVRFEIEPGWHMYWENPGDSGGPPSAKLQPVAGWSLAEPIYPRPSILKTGDEIGFVYEGAWEWILPISGPAGSSPPACTIDLTWMVCKEHCEVGRARVVFAAAEGDLPPLGAARMGRSLPEPGAKTTYVAKDETVVLSISSTATKAQFIPSVMPGVKIKAIPPIQSIPVQGRLEVTIPVEIRPQDSLGKALIFKGLILYGDSKGDRCETIRFSLNKEAATH